MDEKEKSDGVGRSRCCSWSWFLTVVVVDMWENLNVSEETGWERRRCRGESKRSIKITQKREIGYKKKSEWRLQEEDGSISE